MSLPQMSPEDFRGKWYINMTNFPMWLKGDRTSPSLNYEPETRNGITGLKDKVIFTKGGKETSIEGFDKPINDTGARYSWRGNGLLWLLESKWQVLYFDREKQLMITHFDKTIFTPSGMDVISRKKQLSDNEIEEVFNIIKEKGFPSSPALQVIKQA